MDIQKVKHISCIQLDEFGLPMCLGLSRIYSFQGLLAFLLLLLGFVIFLKSILRNRLQTFLIFILIMCKAIYFFS